MTIGHDPHAGDINFQEAATLIHALATSGVREAVVSPGSRNTPIVLALQTAQQCLRNFRVHTIVDERAAGFFALGLARSKGEPVILSCSSGSAGAHYHPALVEAERSGIPLIAITADRPEELHGRGAPQTVPQAGMFTPHVRASITMSAPKHSSNGARGRLAALKLIDAIHANPPGPAHLNVRFREPLWAHDQRAEQRQMVFENTQIITTQTTPPPRNPSAFDITSIAKPRGLIIAGPLDGRTIGQNTLESTPEHALSQYQRLIGQIALSTGWPVLADPGSQLRQLGVCDDQLITRYDLFLRSKPFTQKHPPDVVLAFGEWPTSKVLGQFLCATNPHTVSVQSQPHIRDPWDIVDERILLLPGGYNSSPVIPADMSTDPTWLNAWKNADAITTDISQNPSPHAPLWEGSIAHTLSRSLAPGDAAHIGSSMPIRNVDAFGGALPEDTLIYTSRGANGIDGSIATAAGEALGSGRHTTLWVGDLTFLHDASSLGWIPDKTPLSILVTDNKGGGIFHHLPIDNNKEIFEEYFLTPPKISPANIASGYGWSVKEVRRSDELQSALASRKEAQTVIIAHVDRQKNLRQLRALWRDISSRSFSKEHNEQA